MKKNLLIYATAFFCGMSIMAVELSATRLLAPYFGTSMIIWTVVIGLIMISLSLGNILGGRAADKYNNIGKLYSYIWIASLWIAIIPLIGKYIIALSVAVLMWILPGNLLIAGSVFSCLVVFSFPLVILGMASPYLVKLGSTDFKNNGKITGQISAISTIGSIIGTFIPTFVTIPTIGTNKTFFIFSLILNLICLYYFITTKTKVVRGIASVLIIICLTSLPVNNSYAFWKSTTVEDESLYNYLQVTESDDSVILSTNVAFGVQSIYKKDHALSGLYYDYALMAPLFRKNTDFNTKLDTLILGLGTGTFAKQCKYFFPNTNTVGVEIDQKIVNLSKKYFELTDEEANIYVNDGRTFLTTKDAKKYDLIMVDAYHDITIPFHMSTKEFFSKVKEHLNKDGVLLININMHSEKNTEIMDYLTQTIKSVMKKVYKCDVKDGSNTEVFASDDENCAQNYIENIKAIDDSHPLTGITKYVENNLKEVTESKHVFTDDKAPVEVMGQKVLDEIVYNELGDFKKELGTSGKGFWGIFDLLS
jgi:spermidine synthase